RRRPRRPGTPHAARSSRTAAPRVAACAWSSGCSTRRAPSGRTLERSTPVRAPRWLDVPAPGPWARAALAPLAPAGWAWGAGAWLHRHARGPRFRTPARLACRVVSVGSLTVGGSGKTPVTAWVAATLRARGFAVAIATRGYGRRARRGDVL